LSHVDIAALIDDLGDIGQALNRAGPAGLEDLYATLRLEMIYDADTKTIDVTIRPAGRGSARVRGGTRPLRTHPQPTHTPGRGVVRYLGTRGGDRGTRRTAINSGSVLCAWGWAVPN
jgi:hypothetical protein